VNKNVKPVAYLEVEAPVRLWGLGGRERLRRVLRTLGIEVLDDAAAPPPNRSVLVLRADHLFDERVVSALVDAPGVALRASQNGPLVALHAPVNLAAAARAVLQGEQPADGYLIETPQTLASAYR
jgi:hypothetical protein